MALPNQRGVTEMRVTTYKTFLDREDHIPSLVRVNAQNYLPVDMIRSADDAFWILRDVFNHDVETEEVAYLLCLNCKKHLIGVFELSRGVVDGTLMNPREIVFKALMTNAVSVIVAHNHPSGELSPSEQDIAVTKRLKEALDIVGISLTDHIIVGMGNFLSMREYDLLPKKEKSVAKIAAE